MDTQLRKTVKMYINLQPVEKLTTVQQKIASVSLKVRCQILLLILSELINFCFPWNHQENDGFLMVFWCFQGEQKLTVCLNSLYIRNETWRQSLNFSWTIFVETDLFQTFKCNCRYITYFHWPGSFREIANSTEKFRCYD